MRLIGLIGGLSWESTVPYYCQINQTVKQRLGGLHSARLVLYSVDFEEVERHMRSGDWDAAGELLSGAGRALEAAGARALVLCTNSLHRVAAQIESAVGIPLLHIVDATAAEIARAGAHTVGLLGTRFTMEQPFYRERLHEAGLVALIPDAAERTELHRVIFEELCLGRLLPASRAACRRMMQRLIERGAEGIILGCTELSGLIAPEDAPVRLFDTTAIHARAAAEWSLSAS